MSASDSTTVSTTITTIVRRTPEICEPYEPNISAAGTAWASGTASVIALATPLRSAPGATLTITDDTVSARTGSAIFALVRETSAMS